MVFDIWNLNYFSRRDTALARLDYMAHSFALDAIEIRSEYVKCYFCIEKTHKLLSCQCNLDVLCRPLTLPDLQRLTRRTLCRPLLI